METEIEVNLIKLTEECMQQRIDYLESENKKLREELEKYEGDNK